ncbi:MAG: transporter [Alphaproteobacteria bacterium]|nr:transporter [Alphaproteobacteria bacterium]
MGAIVPAITSTVGLINTVNSAFNAVSNLRSNVQDTSNNAADLARQQMIAEQNQALIQLQQRQSLDEQQRAEASALEKQKLALDASQAEEKRQAALRRAVARQKAAFGGGGIASSGGSADAVLLGLFDESEEELQQREALDNLRNTALDLEGVQAKSVNVLQATQLAERNKLQRLYS